MALGGRARGCGEAAGASGGELFGGGLPCEASSGGGGGGECGGDVGGGAWVRIAA